MSFLRVIAFAAVAALAAAPLTSAEAQSRRGAEAAAPVRRAVSFTAETPSAAGSLVLPLGANSDLELRAAWMPAEEREAVARAIASARFEYGARATLSLRGLGDWDRILVLGLGADPDAAGYQMAGAVAGRALLSEPGAVTVAAADLSAEAVAEFAAGMGIGEYRSDLYRTAERDNAAMGPTRIHTDAAAAAESVYARRGVALVEAMAWTRDVSNEPGNAVYPETFVARARAAFAGVRGVQIQVLDVPAMERLGMGAILGVGRGSERPPRLLVVRYRGRGAPEGGPVVLVGKGITFDSGGLSLKSGDMVNMRMDMSGAASVTGAVLALARAEAPVNVAAIAALAENMPDGAAIRPGDVLTAMNGKTIEVISTDAEGRLVLADALVWAERNLAPAAVVDVATLTGAVRGALGDEYAGLFSRHDALADQLEAAGRAVREPLWRLPLHDSYGADVSSTIADIKNSGGAAGAGAGTGAYFIGEFISRDIPWAHLDIANMAWSGANDWKPDGSAGFGVRLLERFVRDFQPVAPGAED